jgi:hypothetical protein
MTIYDHVSLRGAKAFLFAKNEIKNDSDIETLFNEWAYSNPWGLFGLAVNPKTPLKVLKNMMESDYSDLANLVINNPIFEQLEDRNRNDYFSEFKISSFPLIRDFLGQSDLYIDLLKQAKSPDTTAEDLTKLGNLAIYQNSIISHWVNPEQIEIELDHYFDVEGNFILDDDDKDISEIYNYDNTFIDLAVLSNHPIFPELKWVVLKNPNSNINEINRDLEIKSLKSPPETFMFDGVEGLSQIDDLLPFRLKIALRRFSDDDENTIYAFENFLGGNSSPIELNLTNSLILAHPKTSDEERINFLESLNFGQNLDYTLGLSFLTAGLYVKNANILKKLAEANNIYSAFCETFNPNQTSFHQRSLLINLPEFTIEELGRIYESAKEAGDLDYLKWLESFS